MNSTFTPFLACGPGGDVFLMIGLVALAGILVVLLSVVNLLLALTSSYPASHRGLHSLGALTAALCLALTATGHTGSLAFPIFICSAITMIGQFTHLVSQRRSANSQSAAQSSTQ
jgi:hypothetical protein